MLAEHSKELDETRSMPLAGRTALVTGGARGIGLAITTRLASEGAKVLIADVSPDALDEAAEHLKPAGLVFDTVRGSVAQPDDVDLMIEAALKLGGGLNILVNNAGGAAATPEWIEDVTQVDYQTVLDQNALGTFLCMKAATPALIETKGAIINIASMAGLIGWEHFSPQYTAAKSAVIGMTRNMAKHLGPRGVRVNAIAPGFIRTGPRFDKIWEDTDRNYVLRNIALGRLGAPSEIGDAAFFLASDMSRYITGTTLNVDGGFISI